MTDTHAAAVAALAETFIQVGVYVDGGMEDGVLDTPTNYATAQLAELLADPAKRAALLAVLLPPEALTEAMEAHAASHKVLSRTHVQPDCAAAIITRLIEPDRSETP